MIMWTPKITAKQKVAKSPDNVDITEIEVNHPLGTEKYQGAAAKFSTSGPCVMSPFWYVTEVAKGPNMKVDHKVYNVGECTIKVPKFVNIVAVKKGDQLTYCEP